MSAGGARCKSLGQRPRTSYIFESAALKARNPEDYACFRVSLASIISRFQRSTSRLTISPGALPQAIALRASGASRQLD